MNNNTDKIKIGLLGLIAVTLIVQTFFLVQGDNGALTESAANSEMPVSNMVAGNPTDQAMGNMPPAAEPVSQSASRTKTTLSFVQTEHDFGQIKQETENKKIFKFTNTGNEPLVIENAVGSCGCTVPDYPKEPIAPGKSGEIVVNYKPGQQKGQQTKTVTITSNTEPLTTLLYIKADVQEIAK